MLGGIVQNMGESKTVGLARESVSGDTVPPGSAARPSSPETQVRPRVLVIDDEPLLGQTLKLGLEENFEVEVELSGQRGLARLLAGESFEVIFCDLSLPDLSGMDIFARAVEKRPDLSRAFVIMTGGAVTPEAYEFVENYLGPVLEKPFSLTTVERLMDELLTGC